MSDEARAVQTLVTNLPISSPLMREAVTRRPSLGAYVADALFEKACEQLFTEIYGDLSTADANQEAQEFNLSQGRAELRHVGNLTYGEVCYSSFVQLLRLASPEHGESFADLGHGTGKALVVAATHHGLAFSRIHGIELSSGLFQLSVQCIQKYHKLISSSIFAGHFLHHSEGGPMVTVEEGDFLREQFNEEDKDGSSNSSMFHWSDCDVVFANSTCFDEELLEKLAAKAEKMRAGSRFISLTFPLPGAVKSKHCNQLSNNSSGIPDKDEMGDAAFAIIHQRRFAMSWGAATAYIHYRL